MSRPRVGQKASRSAVFGSEEVERFAALSQDRNPIHLDPEAAARSVFGRPVVHGMLVASLFSGLLGQELPGEGTIYLGQRLSFKAPVYVGERVTASVEVVEVRGDKPIATLKTLAVNDAGTVVVEGEAVVKFT